MKKIYCDRAFYFLLAGGLAYFIIFCYIPMYGVQLAFKDFSFSKGITDSPWVGLDNFKRLFENSDFGRALKNTIIISLCKIIFGFPAPIILALILNEIKNKRFCQFAQTIAYLPHFLSWVVISGILFRLFAPSTGAVSQMITALGFGTVDFMNDPRYFRIVLVVSDIWKGIGWGSIVYLAALTNVDPQLYEAAEIDGAKRLRQIMCVAIPCIAPTIITMLILRMGDVLNAGMDQIYAMQSELVYSVSDTLDILSLRMGLERLDYELSTAVSLFKSFFGLIMIIITNKLCKRIDKDSGLW